MSLSYDSELLENLEPVSKRGVKALLEALTRPPRRYYVRVNTLKATTEEVLQRLELLGLKFHRDEEIDFAIYSEVEGPYKIDVEGKIVVADKRSSEAVYVGSDLYAPGVIRAEGVRKGDRVTVVTPEGMPVGVGIAMMDPKEIFSKRAGLAVKVERSVYVAPKVGALKEVHEGLIYSQSLPSMWAVMTANPRPGELIVDMNAAPGGKVSMVAQIAGPSAKIIAIDRESKAERLKQNLKTLGADWVTVIGGDSRYASDLLNLREAVDLVLVDPPCTNLGVVPKLSDKKTLRDAVTLARYQVQFVREAWRLLKPGGRLVYSTCTLTDIENEGVVAQAEDIGFEVERPERVSRWASYNGVGLRFSPEDGMPGFFIALLRKPVKGSDKV
jgi:16S rRNA (cytosine967-C5)-methyltransferase